MYKDNKTSSCRNVVVPILNLIEKIICVFYESELNGFQNEVI